jgi:hypothetical protein
MQPIYRLSLLSFVVAVLALATTVAVAEPGARAPGQERVADRIAEATGHPVEQLFALRERGMGWGDIEIASLIAGHAGARLDHVAELWRTADREWDIVAAEYGIGDLGQLVSRSKRSDAEDDD